ncbi:MAG: hypothetical protein ABJP45_14530 [Cyclobacteriaceae bacterium]
MKNLFSILLICTAKVSLSQSWPIAEIVDTVQTSVPDQSYALYLPANYDEEKEYPVIFFFEPLARSTFPLNLYRDLADKYEFILTCSNNSRNFASALSSLDAADAIIKDVFSRFKVNQEMVIASGFSGGSRVSMAVATQFTAVRGVIGIGAVGPMYSQHKLQGAHQIPYVGLVGNRDFNYVEHYRGEQGLTEGGVDNIRLVYNRPHQWAPINDYEMGLIWMMKKLSQNLAGGIVSQPFIDNYLQKISDSVSVLDAVRVKKYFESDFAVELLDLQVDKSLLAKKEKQLIKTIELEEKLRQQYQDSLNLSFKLRPNRNLNSPLNWIINAGLSYKRKVDQNEKKHPNRAEMYDRMANFISGSAYEYSIQALMAKNYNQAYVAIEIWSSMVQNDRWENWMKCKLYAMNNDIPMATRYLEKLIKSGFENGKALQADSSFHVLRETKPYIELTSKDR